MSRLTLVSNGITSGELRGLLKNSSALREAGQFITPEGQVLNAPERSDIAQVVTAKAMQDGLMVNAGPGMNIVKGTDPKDFIEMYEKDYYIAAISNEQYKGAIKDTSKRYGPAKQWDHFVLSFDTGTDQDTIDKTRAIVAESLRSIEPKLFIDDKGVVPDSIAAPDGKRAIYMADEHKNTDNPHLHFIVNRHGLDPQTKEVSAGVNLSRVGVFDSTIELINDKLKAAGIQQLDSERTASKVNTTLPIVNKQSQANMADTLEKAGALSADSIAKMPVSSVEISALDQSERLIRDSMSRRQAQIDALMRQQEEEAALVVLAQNSKMALTENAILKEQVENQTKTITELSSTLETTTTAKVEVEQQHQALEEQHHELSEKHQTVVADLEQKVVVLEEVDEAIGNYLDKEELATIEGGAYEQISEIGNRMQEAQQEVVLKIGQIEELNDMKDKLVETIKNKEKTIESKDETIKAKDEAFNKLQEQMTELQTKMEALQEQLTKQNEKLITAERVENTLRNIVISQTGDNSYQSKGAEEAAERLTIRFQEMRQETVRVATERDSLQTQLTVVSEQIGKLSQDKAVLQQSNAQLKEEVSATEKLAAKLELDLQGLKEDNSTLKEDNASLKQALNQMQGVESQAVSSNAQQARDEGRGYTSAGLQDMADKANQAQQKDQKKNQDDDLSNK